MLIVDPFCFRPTEIWPSTPPSEIGAVATVTTSGIQAWFARWEPERGTIDRRVSSARSSGTKAKESSWALLCMSKSVQRGRECRYGPPTPVKGATVQGCAFGLLHPTAPNPHSIGVEIRGSVTCGKLYGAFRNIRSSEWCDGSTALRSNACSGILFRL